MARLGLALLALGVGSLMSPTGSWLDGLLFAAVTYAASWWAFPLETGPGGTSGPATRRGMVVLLAVVVVCCLPAPVLAAATPPRGRSENAAGALWLGPLLGFVSGIGVSVVGALVAHLLQRSRDLQHREAALRKSVYTGLATLLADYFWVTCAERDGTEARPRVLRRIYRQAHELDDLLKEWNNDRHLDDIHRLLFSFEFESAEQRYKQMVAVAHRLAENINPSFVQLASAIDRQNLESGRMAESGARAKVPGFCA